MDISINKNTTLSTGTTNLPPYPKVGYRAGKAIKSAMKRRDSFKMNEFGDVEANDFAEVKLKHLEDKAALDSLPKKAVAANDVAKILAGGQVDVVRESHGARSTKKPLKPDLGLFGTFFAKVADFFNMPTMGRANRMQDEMECRFGRVAGNMLNLSHLVKSKEYGEKNQSVNVNVAAAQKAVKESLVKFFEQRDVFVKAFGLDAPGLDGARNCDRQIVSRLVHSLENAGDVDSLKRLHMVADEWVKDWESQGNRGPEDNVISIMKELRNHVAARLGFGVDCADEAAPVQPEEPAPAQPKPFGGLMQLIDQWKSSLKSTLAKQVKGLEETCQGTANEMEVFNLAFKNISGKLHGVLSGSEKDFSIDKLSVDAFMDVVDEMDKEIGNVIEEGKKIIEKLHKKLHDSKGHVLATMQGGRANHTEIDIKKTNKYLQWILKNTQANADKAESHYETDGFSEIKLDAKKSGSGVKKADAAKPKSASSGASGKKQKPEDPKLIISAMNSVNKAIEAFSAAKHELYHSIRPVVEKLEVVELLAKKELTPPKNPNPPPAAKENCTPEEAAAAKVAAAEAEAKWAADWKDACNTVGKYLLDGSGYDLNNVKSAQLKLISDHREYFVQGLDEKSKQRLELLFDHERLRKGFEGQYELGGLAFACGSFGLCRCSTTEVYGELLDNIQNLENKCGIKPERGNVAKILREELEKSCVACFTGKVKIGVEDTIEGRHDGVFFNGDANGRPTDTGGNLCWISNEDVKDLATHLFNAIRRVGGAFAQEAASELVALKDPELTEKRVGLIKEGQGYLEPLIRAYRDVRDIIATNALTRINDGMQYIRATTPPTQTEESWKELCDKAETAIKGIEGNNVRKAVDALQSLYDEIEQAVSNADEQGLTSEQQAKIGTLKIIEEKFSADLRRLELYGERGKGVLSADIGKMHLDRMVWTMDNLTIAEWRARDMENLVSNALQSIPNFIKAIVNAERGSFLSKWLNVTPEALDRFSISADKLRKNFSDYTKSVKTYLQTLRKEPLESDERKIAADAVRERLGACISSAAPVMELMADIEVFMCERFDGFDKPNDVDIESKVRASIIVDKNFADRFVEMHRSIHNMFAAFSEIGKGSMLDVRDYVKEDGLMVVDSGKTQYSNDAWNTASEKILADDYKGKRCRIVDHSVLSPVTKETRKEHQRLDSPEMAHVRRVLRNEFSNDSTNLSASMLIRASASDDLFGSMENFYLTLSKAKQGRHGTSYFDDDERVIKFFEEKETAKAKAAAKEAGIKHMPPPKVEPTPEQKAAKEAAKAKKTDERRAEEAKRSKMPSDAVIGQIARLVAMRTPILKLDALKSYLRANKVDEAEIAVLDDVDNKDFVENLVAHLATLTYKFSAFGVEKFGIGPIENQIVRLNEFLRVANVNKDYSITAIDITNGEATRVAVKSEELGKEVYYTVHYTPGFDKNGWEDPGLGKIDFVPEANTNVKEGKSTVKEFKAFSVMQTYEVKNWTGFLKWEANKVACPITVRQLTGAKEAPKESADYTLQSIIGQNTGNNPSIEETEGEDGIDGEDMLDDESMTDGLETDQEFEELYGYGIGEE